MTQTIREKIIHRTKRIVIKVGSGILTQGAGLRDEFFEKIAPEIAALKQKNIEVVLVSSGAVACGMGALNLTLRPKQIPKKQAVAAVGQPLLMSRYSLVLGVYNISVAQVLITRADLQNRHRFLNAKHSMTELFGYNILPIVNENDTVAVDEIQFGDNDQLSAMVAHLVDADLLLILTDIDGLYNADPRKKDDAQRISLVEDVDEKTYSFAKGTLNPKSTGGMITKLKAASQAALYGVPTWIVCGQDPSVIQNVFEGKDIGTLCLPKIDPLSSRKYWIAMSYKAKGEIIVDDGASLALLDQKKSLLPSGIKEVKGRFDIGDSISIVDLKGKNIARGLVNYSSQELLKIKGIQSSEIEKILGYKYYDEVIHRDDLVIL